MTGYKLTYKDDERTFKIRCRNDRTGGDLDELPYDVAELIEKSGTPRVEYAAAVVVECLCERQDATPELNPLLTAFVKAAEAVRDFWDTFDAKKKSRPA